jgi:hypothetical protein
MTNAEPPEPERRISQQPLPENHPANVALSECRARDPSIHIWRSAYGRVRRHMCEHRALDQSRLLVGLRCRTQQFHIIGFLQHGYPQRCCLHQMSNL